MLETVTTAQCRTHRGTIPATIVLLVLSFAVFFWRGPWRALRGQSGDVDYAVVYAEGRAWIARQNPYDFPTISSDYLQSGAPRRLRPIRRYTDSVQTPAIFPLAGLMALLPWKVSISVWLVLSCAMYVLASILLAGALPHDWPFTRVCVFAIGLSFSPVLAGISTGQPSVLAMALIIIAVAPQMLNRPVLAGIALGIAICLKPQLGVFFLLFMARRRSWRAGLIAVAVPAVATAVSLVPLLASHSHWLTSLMANIKMTSVAGHANDPSPLNPDAWKLLNFETVLTLVVNSRTWATVASMGLVACGLVVWWKRSRDIASDDLARYFVLLLCLATLILLPVYHRNYDAGVLMLGVVATVLLWRNRPTLSIVFGVLLFPFLFPIPAFLATHLGPAASMGAHLLLLHQVILIATLAIIALLGLKTMAPARQAITSAVSASA